MAEKEQAKPLAPVAYHARSDSVDEALSRELKSHPNKKYIQCCGCIAALLLIQAVIVLVLIFTVFRIQDPKIRMNSVTIQRLEMENGSISKDVNVTLLADVSVKNPNVATFRVTNTKTSVYYGGEVVGEAKHIQWQVKARRTMRRNVTVEIIPVKVLAVPSFESDLLSGALTISSYTRIAGRVKVLGIKKNVVVRLNCTMVYSISRRAFQGEICRPHLNL